MKIVFLESHLVTLNNDIDYSKLGALGDYSAYQLAIADDPMPYCEDVDIIIAHKMHMTRERISQLVPKLKYICEAATGYNNIDIQAAKDYRVRVTNIADYAKYSVTQHIFALTLAFATKLREYDTVVKEGLWQKSNTFDLLLYPTFELYQKKIGIIGFGSIGREVARVAESFRMKVLAYDIVDISKSGYKNYSIDDILRESDIVVLCCPLTESTRNLIDEKAFKKMKRSAILINTARGGIVNENDLANALNSGLIAGAGFDVLLKEPPTEGNPLLDNEVKNLIVTSHSAWSTRESRQRLIDWIADQIKAYINGEELTYIV